MKIFDVFNSIEITISDRLENYNYYRLKYIPIANECEEEYNKVINSNLSIEDIIEKINNMSNKYLNRAIDLSIRILYEKGINNIDRDLLISIIIISILRNILQVF